MGVQGKKGKRKKGGDGVRGFEERGYDFIPITLDRHEWFWF